MSHRKHGHRFRLYFLSAFVGVSICAHVQAASFDHGIWDRLLRAHVTLIAEGHASRVDYRGMAADRDRLTAYLSSLSSVTRVTFDAWPKHEQLAFLINAYNAFTVELILTKYPGLRSIKELGWFLQTPWQKRFIPLLGETVSLDDIEHGMIRRSGRYDEPRIHFALNCASVGCPALRDAAYTGTRLDTQLDDAARSFLSDRSRNRLTGGVLEVSSIFKWYREDFERGWGGFHSLRQFFAAYAQALDFGPGDLQKLRDGSLPIEFLSYDWRLNDVRR